MKKGYVTIWFSMILSVIIGMFGVLLLGVVENGRRTKIKVAADISVNSLFGDYSRYLWDNYKLIYCDLYTDYDDPINSAENKFTYCMNRNIESDGGIDLYKIACITSEVEDTRFATDQSFSSIKHQIITYMRDCIFDEFEEINDKYADLEVLIGDSTEIVDLHKKYMDAINHFSEEELIYIFNSIGFSRKKIYWEREKSFLISDLFEGDAAIVSGVSINDKGCSKSTDMEILSKDNTAYEDKNLLILFEYFIKVCSSRVLELPESLMSYEQEYLLYGYDSDYENIHSFILDILKIRENINLSDYMEDANKKERVAESAAYIAQKLGRVESEGYISIIIEASWIMYESIQDTEALLEGGSNPVNKDSLNWQTEIVENSIVKKEFEYISSGFNYTDYIRIMMKNEDINIVMKRFIDIVETNVHENTDRNSFKMEYLFDEIQIKANIESEDGKKYFISVRGETNKK